MKVYLYHFSEEATNPVWYAGLGVPFKLTSDFEFAKSVAYDTTATNMLIKQLERYYDKTFHYIPLTDAMPTPDLRCDACGFGWTWNERYASREMLSDSTRNHLNQTHLASPLRRSDALSFAKKIKGAEICRNNDCQKYLCGDCSKQVKKTKGCVLCVRKRWQ